MIRSNKQSNQREDNAPKKGEDLQASSKNPCCSGNQLCDMNRRSFIKVSSLVGAASLSSTVAGTSLSYGSSEKIEHYVPEDKHLTSEWIQTLLKRGTATKYKHDSLKTIAMPVGGIAAGQLYLSGDGRLMHWDIFNEHIFSGYGADAYNSNPPESPVDQGFAIRVKQGEKVQIRTLDKKGFPDVEFIGEYPLGKVFYTDQEFPLSIQLTAYSPFIPLHANDSSLPATILEFQIENTSRSRVLASLAGWLQNAVSINSSKELGGEWLNRYLNQKGLQIIEFTSCGKPKPVSRNPPTVFADFENDGYGEWNAEGKAFGSGPVEGTLPHQQKVSGYQGSRLVNSFQGGDAQEGTLTSPVFKIERSFINFLLGGGKRKGVESINLVIQGETVRSSTGQNSEKLSWAYWDVKEFIGQQARIVIKDHAKIGWSHILVDQIEFADEPHPERTGPLEKQEDYGSMGLALLCNRRGVISSTALPEGEMPDHLFDEDGSLFQYFDMDTHGYAHRDFGAPHRAALGRQIVLHPGEKKSIIFLLTWYFPRKKLPRGEHIDSLQGRYYANRFDSALSVARYMEKNYARLSEETKRWHQTYYDSTLPHWLLERLHAPVSNLATSTVQWFKSGRFWGWEGVGCCAGTCTHVWNYAQALARLFPELERNIRENQDLGPSLDPDGRIRFRGEFNNLYAADGQAGTILKCYREHLMSNNNSFLEKNWLDIKKALLYLIRQDVNDDGLIENMQHNTFDINFYGANTFVGSLYLAALRAAEEMAYEIGDVPFAQQCRRIFDLGSMQTVKLLFNGEYFVQDVNLDEHPEHQYERGCLSDQLFGQGWAAQLGLGYIYPPQIVRTTLQSIYQYNWAPDVGPQNAVHRPERIFARPDEAGLFTCTWPKSQYLNPGVRYKNEIWTGIEYQVAGHLLYEGYLKEGLSIIRGIHERYNGQKHNPFNEVECGDHYARALASWGCLIALQGFTYHGPKGFLGFSPRLFPEHFKSAFTTAEGWGSYEQIRADNHITYSIQLKWGQLRLNRLRLQIPQNTQVKREKIRLNRGHLNTGMSYREKVLEIQFPDEIILNVNDELSVRLDL